MPQASASGAIQSGTIAGKLNGVIPATTPSGWRSDQLSIPDADLFSELAFEQLRNAGRELDVFQSTRGFALGVGQDFAMLRGDDPGELVHVLLEQLAEAEHHPRAAQWRLRGPFRKRRPRGRDGSIQFGPISQRNQCLHLTGCGVVDIRIASGIPGDGFAADPVRRWPRGALAAEESILGRTAVDMGRTSR